MNRTVSKCLLPTDKRAVDVSCEQSHRITGVFQDEMSDTKEKYPIHRMTRNHHEGSSYSLFLTLASSNDPSLL